MRRPWAVVVLAAVLPVVAGVCFALLGLVDGAVAWALLGAGAAALVGDAAAVLALERSRRRQREAELDAASRLRVAMRDALQPLAELVAAMPYASPRDRQAALRQASVQAVGSLVLLLRDVDRLRAVVYALDEDAGSLQPLAYHGRAATPTPFVRGTPRGDLAVRMVTQDRVVFVRDLDAVQPEDWAGSGDGYRTFVAAAVAAGPYAYGMVTVDAPRAGDLGDDDRHVVTLLADLLAIAFAEAHVARAGAGAESAVDSSGAVTGPAGAAAGGPPGAGGDRTVPRVGVLPVAAPRPPRVRDLAALTDPAAIASAWDDAAAAVRADRAHGAQRR